MHFNILRHESDTADLGVPVHLIARRILDEAASVEEAAGIARSARVSASTVITVVTESDAGSIEISPAGVAVIPPGPDGVLLHCNHFLDADLAAGERHATQRPGTFDRFRHLSDHVEGLRQEDQNARALAMLSHAPRRARLRAPRPHPAAQPAVGDARHDRARPARRAAAGAPGRALPGHRGDLADVLSPYVKAAMPVSALPMTSWWTSEVPS
ncbi:carcinine hydrolase/isopenicillin-N N-acyltransferase family protein [Nonomuraea salmonea]|uniref:carcinine hydrolase/isopenicillin-N N-acyltransferase family protein n=1 Tax=Nonomuraea salmonea TaxID=46181 RepID=UPI002FE80641